MQKIKRQSKNLKKIGLVFPHQLFQKPRLTSLVDEIYIIEEFLFFKQFNFHKTKLAYHRASMKYYCDYVSELHDKVHYVSSYEEISDIRVFIQNITQPCELVYYEVTDDWLQKRIQQSSFKKGIPLQVLESPLFINSLSDLSAFFTDKKRFYQTDFYIYQRKRLNIMVDQDGSPHGGKWSYDADNRAKYPKTQTPPKMICQKLNSYDLEARIYVEKYFGLNNGMLKMKYPTTHNEAKDWLLDFLINRFEDFGIYEDAIVKNENFLNHSVLSPMINCGLLSPLYVVDQALKYAKKHNTPINSLEGFVRQIVGWREYIRAVYVYKGREERTKNFWNFFNPLPSYMYTADSGIPPLDDAIAKVIHTAYNHHIERLMVLGNYLLLMEVNPNEAYRWFMEMYIDAYDWVMVPNVYGMSQYADGGMMSTKPYLCSSNYILKMSNHSRGIWQKQMDDLFWKFLLNHRTFFIKNHRMSMLIKAYEKKNNLPSL